VVVVVWKFENLPISSSCKVEVAVDER